MELADRVTLRDSLASACSMTPIGGATPGLLSNIHFIWFYPDGIVQLEIGGRHIQTISYAGDPGAMPTVEFFKSAIENYEWREIVDFARTDDPNTEDMPAPPK